MQWFCSLDVWLQALLASLLTYSFAALGAMLVFFAGRIGKTALTALTGGAAGIMIAASFFSLLLPALGYESFLPPYLTVSFGFLLGGGFIVLSDLLFSRKIAKAKGDGRAWLVYLAVTLHNLPEGMAVGVSLAVAAGDPAATALAMVFAFGIAVQNFPEGACVAFPLRTGGMGRGKSFFLAQLSGAAEIPACILGAVAASFVAGLLPWALSFSAGAMIAVVCSELVPESFSGNKTVASASILLGFCLMMILDIALG